MDATAKGQLIPPSRGWKAIMISAGTAVNRSHRLSSMRIGLSCVPLLGTTALPEQSTKGSKKYHHHDRLLTPGTLIFRPVTELTHPFPAVLCELPHRVIGADDLFPKPG